METIWRRIEVRPALLCIIALGYMLSIRGTALATTPADPCQTSSVVKHSLAISLSTGVGVAQLIVASSQSIHVCGYSIDGSSFSFQYSSNSDCSTGAVQLTGVFFNSNNPSHTYSGPGTVFSIPANNSLCLNSTTAPNEINGILTYTQP